MRGGVTLVDVFGSCIARDVFGFHPESTAYQVKTFVQSQSLLTAMSPSLQEIGAKVLEPEDISAARNDFWRKVVLTSANSTTLSQLSDSAAKWLVLELSDSSTYSLMKVRNMSTCASTYLTFIGDLQDSMEQIKANGKLRNCEIELIAPNCLEQAEKESALNKFIQEIKKIYPEERIVLLETMLVNDYVENEEVKSFDNQEYNVQLNELCVAYFSEATKLLPNSYVIRMPRGVYADPQHKWGLANRHYDSMYYDYALKAFHVIGDDMITDKQARLDYLYDAYSAWYSIQRKKMIRINPQKFTE